LSENRARNPEGRAKSRGEPWIRKITPREQNKDPNKISLSLESGNLRCRVAMEQ